MRSNQSPKLSHTSETYSGDYLGSRRTLQGNTAVVFQPPPERPFLWWPCDKVKVCGEEGGGGRTKMLAFRSWQLRG